MKITEKSLSKIYIISIIPMAFISMSCENKILKYGILIGYIALLVISSTWYYMDNRPIKNKDKISLICLYVIAILGLIYVCTRNFKWGLLRKYEINSTFSKFILKGGEL